MCSEWDFVSAFDAQGRALHLQLELQSDEIVEDLRRFKTLDIGY